MEAPFADQALRWHDFAVTSASAAAALVGLLFVAMSLRSDVVSEDYGVEHAIWSLGAIALVSFLDIVLLGLVILVPGQTPFGLGGPVLVLAALAIAVTLSSAADAQGGPTLARYRWWSAGTTLVCYAAQGGLGLALVVGSDGLLPWLAVLTGALLLNASYSSWMLLRTPILRRVRRAPRRAGEQGDGAVEGEPPAARR